MPEQEPEIDARRRPRWIETFEDLKQVRVGQKEALIAWMTAIALLALFRLLPGESPRGGISILERLVNP